MSLTADDVRTLLDYDPETGRFTWRERAREEFANPIVAGSWNKRYAGKPALTAVNSEGYCIGFVRSVAVRAHRLAILLTEGEWPSGQVDHINGHRDDNRRANIRVVNASGNQRNAQVQKNNTSGTPGVTWKADRQKWQASIKVDGREIYLGWFEDKQRAVSAREAANDRYGFTPRRAEMAA